MTTTDLTDLTTVVTVIRAAGRAGVTPCLWGDPGTGKSSLIRAAATADGVSCETVLGSLHEPSDFAGLPVVSETGVRLQPPAYALRLAEAKAGYLFLDELSTAPPATQAAMLGVVLERRIGDLTLPEQVRVITAANDPDTAADGWDLTPPMANRLLHIDFQPPTDPWLTGMTAGFTLPASRPLLETTPARRAIARAKLAAFINARPELLHVYPGRADTASTGRAWPSRRTWTMTADVLALLPDADRASALMAATGLVGPGPAMELVTWLQHADLPDPADVLADPTIVDWAGLDPSRIWAVLVGVVAYCTSAGTKDQWRSAWGPLAIAAENGRADVAAACARTLMSARPAGANPPKDARAFTAVLTDAGLMTGGSR